MNSELSEKQENQQGESHEEHVDTTAAKQVIYLDGNMINLPNVRVPVEGTKEIGGSA